MKPCSLEFCGINSFSESAEIDFSELLEFGIFGIFGDTGSGKSTILDCIGFALYGSVARSRSGSIADIINYQSDKAYVNFEFEVVYEGKRRRFRAERELKRKNAVQSARVYELVNGAYAALSEGVRESNALLEKIVGLEQKDFEKCIALPQGEFSQFVKSARSDRLKLISRLFDLEQYGERLVKKTNAKCTECAESFRLAQTRLEPYADVSVEALSALETQTAALEEAEKTQSIALSAARAEEKRLTALFEKRKEAEAIAKRFSELEARRSEMLALEGELSLLECAAAVLAAEREALTARKDSLAAEEELRLAEEGMQTAEAALKKLAEWDEDKADEEIARLTELRERARQSAQAEKKRAETARELEKKRAEYVEEASKFKDFSYEAEKERLQESLSSLGEGDLFSFIEREGKESLLRAEYGIFAAELSALNEKYPQIGADALPLIEKYKTLSLGEKKDIARIRAEYEAREQTRRELTQKQVELEKRNGLYRAHRERLSQLQTEGVRLKELLAEYEKQCAETQGATLEEVEKRLNVLTNERRAHARERDSALALQTKKTAAHAAAQEKHSAARKAAEQAQLRLSGALERGGFASASEAETLVKKFGNAEEAKNAVTRFREDYAAVSARHSELSLTDYSQATQESVAAAKEVLSRAEELASETVGKLTLSRVQLTQMKVRLEQKRLLEKELSEARKQAEIYERLKKLFEANKFMDFVAEEYLQNVATNASGRLLSLTDGRYFLRYEGGAAGFCVGDNFNGGKTRGVNTLSGGETFLVSLSLALALSSEICARSLRPIEFFFLDEGFGTLDEKLVDTVMDSLERLKSENFAIGIISHVEELKHRIDRKLSVEKATEKHGSRIYVE